MIQIRRALLAMVLVSGILAFQAHFHQAIAQLPPDQEKSAKQIFFEVMSPFCPGRSLNDCPSSAAVELKNEIRSRVQGGESHDQIMTALVARFGEEIRATPSVSGFGSIAWAAPLSFLFLGGVILALWVRSRQPASQPSLSQSPSSPSIDPELQRRIDQELSK